MDYPQVDEERSSTPIADIVIGPDLLHPRQAR